jgi:preprotein translocase subunit YajC
MDTAFLLNVAPWVLIFAIFYFLMIRPQQQRAKQHREMLENVRRGDTVVTAGGIVGRVAKVKDEGEVMVEIADNIQVRVLKNTLSEVRTKGQTDSKSDSADSK